MPDLVIARYNEDVSWLVNVPDDFNIFLYNKGDELDISNIRSKLKGYFRIQNIGRESDTYLLHIIHNMGKTDSFTVFSQGDPFEHSPDFLRLLTHRFADDAWGYSSQWKQGFPPAHLIETHIARTGQPTRNEIFSLYNWGPIYSFDEGAFLISRLYFSFYGVENGTNIAADFFGRIGYEAARHKAAQATLGEFPYAAIFGVRNSVVSHISNDIFLRALHEVRTNQMAGHIMERLWLHFFGRPFISIGTDASPRRLPQTF
ncbi:DUF3431 domain-containing protein [Gluconacetobacter liquefaciens]|uniref:Uncharacterized protein n=1 Tax=Gluconacetobacter liquefaciens TaxID=89584 RepID=A0A370G9C8_GLULI|nr:hypothetical protein [Gluconacetobacter liquefaciens]RDI39776.1 hypothetical protein C7453_102572 [Gluconacetobacter liquefaciens]